VLVELNERVIATPRLDGEAGATGAMSNAEQGEGSGPRSEQ